MAGSWSALLPYDHLNILGSVKTMEIKTTDKSGNTVDVITESNEILVNYAIEKSMLDTKVEWLNYVGQEEMKLLMYNSEGVLKMYFLERDNSTTFN